jgi:predicted transcriptional regulator
MNGPTKFELLADAASLPRIENEEALSAIKEGMEDAKNGRVVSLEEVRKHLAQWTTESSSRKER